MLSIEKALGMYAEDYNKSNKNELSYFEKELSKKDFKEFLELIKVVKLVKIAKPTKSKEAIKFTDSFESIFEKLNKHRIEYYANTLPEAAGFKHVDDVTSEKEKAIDLKAIQRLNEMYEEEFGEDGLRGQKK